MESFALLKRRTTDLFQSLPQSLPSLPTLKPKSHAKNTMKGTWERISIPPLPRSSHSLDVVSGTAYIFGGEVSPRQPVDNDMHAIVLPSSGAPADYYAIKAVAARPSVPIIEEPAVVEPEAAEDKGKGKELAEIPLSSSSPPPAPADAKDEEEKPSTEVAADDGPQEVKDKGKGKALPPLGSTPAARVGHATAVIGSRIFLFGGRGGPDMTPLDERGRVWVFDTKTHTWDFLDPAAPAVPDPISPSPITQHATHPAPRSYHAAVATDKPDDFTEGDRNRGGRRHPRRAESWKEWAEGDSAEVGTPQRPIVGNVAARARDADSDGFGTFIVHGGCLAGGARASDVWAFDVHTRVWKELPAAPGRPRGGTALCIARSRLYRFGGFNGEGEEGGQLDFLELGVDTFDDSSSFGEEVTLAARGEWQSLSAAAAHQNPSQQQQQQQQHEGTGGDDEAAEPLKEGADKQEDDDDNSNNSSSNSAPTTTAPTASWPGARSVAGFEAITTGGGWEYLVLLLGERSPSGAGHEAAGQFWDDVWAFQVPATSPQGSIGGGVSVASVTDAIAGVLGRHKWSSSSGAGAGAGAGGEGSSSRWTRVEAEPYDDEDDAAIGGPGPRGWIASAPMGELEQNGIVVFGGLDGANRRLGDAWILRLG